MKPPKEIKTRYRREHAKVLLTSSPSVKSKLQWLSGLFRLKSAATRPFSRRIENVAPETLMNQGNSAVKLGYLKMRSNYMFKYRFNSH